MIDIFMLLFGPHQMSKCTTVFYSFGVSPLNSYLYVHWKLDFISILLLLLHNRSTVIMRTILFPCIYSNISADISVNLTRWCDLVERSMAGFVGFVGAGICCSCCYFYFCSSYSFNNRAPVSKCYEN